MLSIFLVDDEYKAIVRLTDLLSNIEQIKIVGSAYSFKEAVQGILQTHPDVVFLDIEIRERSGFEVVKAINDKGLFPKIIFVTGHHQYAVKALRTRAIDYLLKPIDLEELTESIARIEFDGSRTLCDSMPRWIENQKLSERESQILELICKGLNSKEIAKELYLSVHTIDTYRRKLLKRFSVRNTQELLSVMLQSFMHQS